MKFGLLILLLMMTAFACGTEGQMMGDKLFKDGQYEKAINAYTAYLVTDPDNIKHLYNRGRAYEEAGKTAKAKIDFQKIIHLNPKHFKAYLSMAKLFYDEHQYNKALIYISKAIKLNENSADAHFLSAIGAHQLGYFDQALESYRKVISLNKNYGKAYLYRGALKISLKKRSSACEDLKIAQLLEVEGADKVIKEHCK